MIEVDKISLRQYLELEDRSEYDFLMKYAFCFTEPIDEFKAGDMTEMPFGFVKDLQYEIEQGIKFDEMLKTIGELSKLSYEQLGNESLDKIIRFSNYIIESIRQIVDVENKTLAHEMDADEEQAGINRFDGLGVYLQIRSLTGGDVTKYDKVRDLRYSICLTEMYTAKQLAEYERDLNKLKNR